MVGEMLRRRMILEQVSLPGEYPLQKFGLRATDADIAAAEAQLDHPLDAQHSAILREFNGWGDAFAHADLLSTDELGQGPLWQQALTMLRGYYEDGPAIDFPPREAIYPFHVGENHLFVIDMAGPITDGGHPVHWLDGELLDTWPNAYHFWLAGFALLDRTIQRAATRRADQEHS
jgi:hypothetical protein